MRRQSPSMRNSVLLNCDEPWGKWLFRPKEPLITGKVATICDCINIQTNAAGRIDATRAHSGTARKTRAGAASRAKCHATFTAAK